MAFTARHIGLLDGANCKQVQQAGARKLRALFLIPHDYRLLKIDRKAIRLNKGRSSEGRQLMGAVPEKILCGGNKSLTPRARRVCFAMARAKAVRRIVIHLDTRVALEAVLINRQEYLPVARRQTGDAPALRRHGAGCTAQMIPVFASAQVAACQRKRIMGEKWGQTTLQAGHEFEADIRIGDNYEFATNGNSVRDRRTR